MEQRLEGIGMGATDCQGMDKLKEQLSLRLNMHYEEKLGENVQSILGDGFGLSIEAELVTLIRAIEEGMSDRQTRRRLRFCKKKKTRERLIAKRAEKLLRQMKERLRRFQPSPVQLQIGCITASRFKTDYTESLEVVEWAMDQWQSELPVPTEWDEERERAVEGSGKIISVLGILG